jgi:hypothetical protein
MNNKTIKILKKEKISWVIYNSTLLAMGIYFSAITQTLK